jgi:cytochrome c oxidase assembly protein subunit 15
VIEVGETEVGTRRTAGIAGNYRGALLVTTGLVYLTVILGVSTRATAAGLACNAQWPLCDGGLLNLFPATLPSAFEWIHRVVAMLAGFGILGSALAAWRGRAGRRVLGAIALAAALLPLQVYLGRETVLTFAPPVLAAHYWVAMAIYAAVVVAAVAANAESLSLRHVRWALGVAAVSTPIAVLLGPPAIVRYSAPIQATQYAAVLLAFGALLFATLVTWRRGPGRPGFRALLLAGTALVPTVVALMRQRIVHPDSAIATAHPVAAALALLAVFGAAALAFWGTPRTDPAG